MVVQQLIVQSVRQDTIQPVLALQHALCVSQAIAALNHATCQQQEWSALPVQLAHSLLLVHRLALRAPVGNMQRLRHKQVVQYVRLAPSAAIHSRSRSLVLVATTLLEVLCSVLYAQQGTAVLLQVLYRSSVPMEQSPRWARLIARSATGAMHAQILLECQLHVILAHTATQGQLAAHHAQQANRVQIQQTSL